MSPQPPMGNGQDERRTPPDLFARYSASFRFTLDGAASHENALVDRYCTLGGTYLRSHIETRQISSLDGLSFPWDGEVVWLNPPYGRGRLEPFVKKAYESRRFAYTVALLPVRTEQAWFHDYVWTNGAPREGVEIDFLRKRLKFDGMSTGAPFPSMVVAFHGSDAV